MFKLIMTASLLLATGFLISNCDGEKKQAKVESLEQEVMELHNQLMPRMGEIARLKEQLEKRKEGLDSLAGQELQSVDDLLVELSEANDGMMNWMRNYSGEFEKMTEKEVEEYLKEQQQDILEVENRISRAIDAAKKELEK